MSDRSFAAGIIARRFGYTRPNADVLAGILSEDELSIVEEAARDVQGPVRIATVIYNARMRAALRIADPILMRRAINAAKIEASDHYQTIKETVPEVHGADSRNHASCDSCQGCTCRVYPTPPEPTQ
jgi:hypothetical protein